MLSDAEIAASVAGRPIVEIARQAGLNVDEIEPYGRRVAKVPPSAVPPAGTGTHTAKYVMVSAVTPTPLGEGKTTTSVGLVQALARLGHRATLVLRQPSLGPTLGIKGGAAGGGYSQVIPMESMNLHLTGDFHAVTAAHNLLAAMIDAHLFHGNLLRIDPQAIMWRRVLDLNDRALRNVVIGLGRKVDGVPRQTGFDITAASEIMVILSLARDIFDLRARLGRIVIGANLDGEPVTADDLEAAGAMTVLLRDAIHPNLLQTLEGTPVLVHTGPFGNIATGASSVIADDVAARMGDIVVTEAGFGSDMGTERFINVKCRVSGRSPDAVVLVVTVRALKAHSGRFSVRPGRGIPPEMLAEGVEDVRAGRANLEKHISIVRGFGVTPVVAINVFPTDTEAELAEIEAIAAAAGVRVARTTHVRDGGIGAEGLAEQVLAACVGEARVQFTYAAELPLADKISAVATQVYGADGVDFSPAAVAGLRRFTEWGFGELPVVIAKTHLSISADAKQLGAPTGWVLPVREVRIAAGAGYVYAIASDMQTMPGLGAGPAAKRIDIDRDGNATGLS